MIIAELSILSLIYNGNMENFNKIIDYIIEKFPKYKNFINNYFIAYKKYYF